MSAQYLLFISTTVLLPWILSVSQSLHDRWQSHIVLLLLLLMNGLCLTTQFNGLFRRDAVFQASATVPVVLRTGCWRADSSHWCSRTTYASTVRIACILTCPSKHRPFLTEQVTQPLANAHYSWCHTHFLVPHLEKWKTRT
jgi:hypothetical protein